MNKQTKNSIQKAFKEAFNKNVLYADFHIDFSEVSENATNARISGTYKFNLIGSTPAECLKDLGGVVGEDFDIEDDENTIQAYIAEEDSSVMTFDGFRTIYFEENDEEMGESLAKSLNAAISKIIDEPKKKRSDTTLPFGKSNK